MSEIHGKGSKIFLGAYDFSGQGLNAYLRWAKDVAKTTAFGSVAHSYAEGSIKCTIGHRGLFDGVSTGWDKWLQDNMGSFAGEPITIIPGTPALGGVCFNGEILAAKIGRTIPIGDMVALDAEYDIDGWLGSGKVIEYELDAEVGAQTGATQNMSADVLATEMYVATIHCVSISNAGTYTIKVQHSPTGEAAWSDITGMSLQCTTVNSKVVAVAGSLYQYVRVVTLQNAGSPTCKFVVGLSKLILQ